MTMNTIIVMLILATVIVMSLSNNNVIQKANTAVSQTNLKNMEEAANVALGDLLLENSTSTSGATTEPGVDDIIAKMKENGVPEEEIAKYTIGYSNGKVSVSMPGDTIEILPIEVSVGEDATLTWTNGADGSKFTVTGSGATTDFELGEGMGFVLDSLSTAINEKLGLDESSFIGSGVIV